MDISEARNLINKTVIASTEFWGTYTGNLNSIWENLIALSPRYRWKGKMKIIKCIGSPSQLTIDGKNTCPRTAYFTGQVVDFNISEIEGFHG